MKAAVLHLEDFPEDVRWVLDDWRGLGGENVDCDWPRFDLMAPPSRFLPTTMVVDIGPEAEARAPFENHADIIENPRRSNRPIRNCVRGQSRGEEQGYPGAFAGLAFNRQPAAMKQHDLMAVGEAKAGALELTAE